VWRGRQAVAQQPAAACALFVDSTSASDTNTCYVEGVITGGYPRSVSVLMTGASAANISTLVTDWIRVDKFYLSAAAVGTVTLHETASGGIGSAHAALRALRDRRARDLSQDSRPWGPGGLPWGPSEVGAWLFQCLLPRSRGADQARTRSFYLS
jgi:hypothetical protein